MLDTLEKSSTVEGDFAKDGWAVVETPVLSDEVLASFDDLPRDMHSLSRHRTARLTQYFAYHEEGEWFFAPLPRRDYVQSAEYIKLPEAGGVRRFREQLTCDPTPVVEALLAALPVNLSQQYQINVNQFRVIVNSEFDGIPVPEGPHRDGHQFSGIGVVRRHQIEGAETTVIDPKSGDVVFRTTLQSNQFLLIDDARYIHYTSDFAAADGHQDGFRDIWVIEFDPWEQRCYGPLHEQRALASSVEPVG